MIIRLHEVLQGLREPLLISKRRCRWLKYQTKSVERDRSHFHKQSAVGVKKFPWE